LFGKIPAVTPQCSYAGSPEVSVTPQCSYAGFPESNRYPQGIPHKSIAE